MKRRVHLLPDESLYADVLPELFGKSVERPPLSQRQRRLLVLGLYGGFGIFGWSGAAHSLSLSAGSVAGGCALLGMLWAFWMLATRVGLPDPSDPNLDERQLQRVYAVGYTAYGALFFLMLGGLVYLFFAQGGVLTLPYPRSGDEWFGPLLACLFMGMTLPTAILAWTEPDATDGDL